MSDETDASDVSLLERRDDAAGRPVVVETKADGLVVVETKADGLVVVEPKADGLVVVEPKADGLVVVEPKTDGLVVVEATPDRPTIVEAAADGPVVVETIEHRPAIVPVLRDGDVADFAVETTMDRPVVVPVMRDGDAADLTVAALPTDIQAPGKPAPRRLRIGPFQISDLSQLDVVSAIVRGTMAARSERAWVTYALHVGGLNQRKDNGYLDAMSRADLVYADGMSIIILAKLAGARAAERAGTTDIGWTVMQQLGLALGRPARVALIGGPDGLTQRAGQVIEADAVAEVVFTEHGYHEDWAPVLDRLVASGCDIVLVGLGAPREMKWVDQHVQELPPCLVMTCGGWFGFITQDEKRAPRWVCRAGLEWTYRLVQSPRRLYKRYAKGALSTAGLAVEIMRTRSHPV